MSDEANLENAAPKDDLLWRQLKTIPAFRALLRAVETRFYQVIELPEPVLDVGCGDGHFAQVTFDKRIQAGIDPSYAVVEKAQATAMYDLALASGGADLPFPDEHFASAFSNSVLEHIPDVDAVLVETNRVLQMNGRFVITTPSHYFTENLGGAAFFHKLGMDGMADRYRGFFNKVSRHAHTDSPERWAERFAAAGFEIERWQYYFSAEALHALEIGHVQGLPSWVIHALTGHWVIAPWESSLKPTERWVRPFYEEAFQDTGAYILIIAKKVSDGPVDVPLPPAQPYSLDELNAALLPTTERTASVIPDLPTDEPSEEPIIPASVKHETPVAQEPPPAVASSRVNLLNLALIGLALLLAMMGQSAWRADPDNPGRGLLWFGLSAVALGLFFWLRGERPGRLFHRPQIGEVPAKRWLIFLALFLALLAQRFVLPGGEQRPLLAISVWLVAIALAWYALYTPASHAISRPTRSTIIISLLLFSAALLVRLFNLSSQPFILNGIEADIGLDALHVVEGVSRNPFGTGWLTNPTLPLYLLAVPLRLFGPTVFGLRFLSAVAGALTVVATFLIGQRLWSRAVGLGAAVLLLGSHFHLHFSRLGITNVWDALLILLALGLIGIAWQQETNDSRLTWLLAGLAIGLNTYLYTSSHLLPIMLLALLLWTLLVDRQRLRRQWRHLLAAALLALVVALPQMLYYRAMPGVFMERANVLGILDSQSGWLGRETAVSGQTQLQLIGRQFGQAALGFNATLDQSNAYGPFVPLLNFVAGVLFIIGFTLALFHWRDLRYNLLAIWVLVTVVFGGALMLNPPSSHRLIIAAPALMLLASLALVMLAKAAFGTEQGDDEAPVGENGRLSSHRYLLITVLIITLMLAFLDLGYYFGPYQSQHHFGDRNTEIAHEMATYLNNLEGEWTVYFYGPPTMYVGFPSITFLAQDFQDGTNLFDVSAPNAALQPAATSNVVHIFLPERQNELTAVQAAFQGGQTETVDGYYASPLFLTYKTPK